MALIRTFFLVVVFQSRQFLLHNNDVSFVFHVFIDDIPDADIQRLSQLAKSYHTCIQIHLVNCERLEGITDDQKLVYCHVFPFCNCRLLY